MSFKVSSSSISFLFWTSNIATRLSRHFTYSFFRRRHSFAASLKKAEVKRANKNAFWHATGVAGAGRGLGNAVMMVNIIWTPLCFPKFRTTLQKHLRTTGIARATHCPFLKGHMAICRIASSHALISIFSKIKNKKRSIAHCQLLCFMAIKIFEGLEFLNESLVLVLKHSHAIFKTFDILLLLPATLTSSFPGTNTRQMTIGKGTAQWQPG